MFAEVAGPVAGISLCLLVFVHHTSNGLEKSKIGRVESYRGSDFRRYHLFEMPPRMSDETGL